MVAQIFQKFASLL